MPFFDPAARRVARRVPARHRLVRRRESQGRTTHARRLATVGNDWLVTSGASDGDRVVIDGLQKAAVGSAVNPIEVTIDSEKTGLVAGLQGSQADAAGARQD